MQWLCGGKRNSSIHASLLRRCMLLSRKQACWQGSSPPMMRSPSDDALTSVSATESVALATDDALAIANKNRPLRRNKIACQALVVRNVLECTGWCNKKKTYAIKILELAKTPFFAPSYF